MRRSVAQFSLTGLTQTAVLASAQGFASQEGMSIVGGSPNHVTIARGSELWTGERIVRVGAWDAPGGVHVAVEAWAELWPWGAYDANPRAIWGFFARRDAWKLATYFVARLGVTGRSAHFVARETQTISASRPIDDSRELT